jgi:hypothetical protein
VRGHEQIRGEQRWSAMATARRSSGLLLGHHTQRGARRSKRIIFTLAGAVESCFLHRGGLELLLLVRKRELRREGEGATSVMAMREANAQRFLTWMSSLFCVKMAS